MPKFTVQIAFVLLLAGLFSFKGPHTTVTVLPGRGLTGIEIGKSQVKDVQGLIAQHFKATIYDYHMTHQTHATLNYEELGMRFQFIGKNRQPKLKYIYLTKPFKGETPEGIRLGKSTFQDVIEAYGEHPWKLSGHDIYKEYEGISFYAKSPVRLHFQDLANKEKLDKLFLNAKIYKFIVVPLE